MAIFIEQLETGLYKEPAEDKEISEFESKLGVIFPEEYRGYLKRYNTRDIGGEVIYSVNNEDNHSVLHETLKWREHGLPKEYIVLYYQGEFILVMDTKPGNEGKLYWQQFALLPKLNLVETDFESFLEFAEWVCDNNNLIL